MVYSLLRDLGYMDHTFLTGSKFYESSEVFNTDNLTFVYLTFLEIGHYHLYHMKSIIDAFLIDAAYRHCTVIGYINLNTGLFNNCINGLTSLTDHIANLSRIDLNLNNLR